MAGGLLQQVIYGPQDVFLTNDPQITFFKIVYRRHTNFSIESLEKTFNDNPDFGKKSITKLFKLGDLASKMYLKVTISKLEGDINTKYAWIRRLGHALIKSVEITIGGARIDKQYGTWLDIWCELARQGDHDKGYNKMIGDIPELTTYNNQPKPVYTLWIPLQFWFNRYYGLALPLISIQYQEIYINVQYEQKEKLIIRNTDLNLQNVKILEVGLVTDYIYLDLEERKKFADTGHEYLIEIVQLYESDSILQPVNSISLDFNLPTKEIIWAMRNGNYISGKRFLGYCADDDWSNCILEITKNVLIQSSLVLPKNGTNNLNSSLEGYWEEFDPVTNSISEKCNLIVQNNNKINSLWINTQSLIMNNYNLIDAIEATIILNEKGEIMVTDIQNGLSERDISIPIDELIDTRVNKEGVIIYQFSNYGLLITGKINPIEFARLNYNDLERVEKREGNFFGVLQPYLNHRNTPKDGINLYSFSIDPEKLQPSGTSNFSKIENIVLTLWLSDKNKKNFFHFQGTGINLFNFYNQLYIFGFSYNILRIMYGLTAIVYS